jgi:hypothetical protein
VDGSAFLLYAYRLGDVERGFNEFDVDRIYVGFNWRLGERSRVRYTLEGGDIRENGEEQFDVVTKHFFVEVRDLLHARSFLHFGLANLPWVPYEERLWGYRAERQVFADREGYLTSTDLGVFLGGELPGNAGNWHAGIANGEGWRRREEGKHKDAHARFTWNPFHGARGRWKNLMLAGFGSVGAYDDAGPGPDDRDRAIALLGYKEDGRVTLAAEALWAEDRSDEFAARHPSLASRPGEVSRASGWSAFGTVNLGAFQNTGAAGRWEIFARWDGLDPDDRIPDNSHYFWVTGASFRFNRHARGIASYSRAEYEPGALVPDDARAALILDLAY